MKGIYKITNIQNNKCYIGKTNDSNRRWADHQRLAFTKNHKEYEKALYKAMRKYGLANFTFEIIEEIEDYDIKAGEREQYWISYYDSYNLGYNETLGGDGGSSPGHCLGESNGRAKLTEEDVIQIRTLYAKGASKQECYILYQNKITSSGFAKVWNGYTWKHIMPEVYTEENKKRNAAIGKGISGKRQRKFSKEQVIDIRTRRDLGESGASVYKDYVNIGSKSSFDDIWYNRKYINL